MDFSDDGQILYVADAQTLNVYLTVNGQSYRKLSLKIHEIEQVCHTHNNSAVLVATKKNHLVLYWSIHENRVIKMFKGHTDSITSLVLNPKDDYFLTTSSDNSMRIWNLNSKGQGTSLLMQIASSSSMYRPSPCQLTQWLVLTQRVWHLPWLGHSSRRRSRWCVSVSTGWRGVRRVLSHSGVRITTRSRL